MILRTATESSSGRPELTEAQKAENKSKTEYLEKVIQRFFRPTIDSFADSPAHQKHIERDKDYVADQKALFKETLSADAQYHPKAIEYLTQFAIYRKDLFGSKDGVGYSAEPIWPTDFDDYKNRVDAALFLHSEGFDCPIALDITTIPNETNITEKILIDSNDQNLGYHVGFTDIRYCRDRNGERTWQTYVPRYCVGMDKSAVDEALLSVSIEPGKPPSFEPKEMALISFKILYEISVQNKLFITPLLDELQNGGKLNEEEQKALDRLGTINLIIDEELKRLTKKLPDALQLALGPGDENGNHTPAEVAQLLSDRNSAFNDKTFASIIRVTASLQKDLDESPYKISHLAERSFRAAHDKISANNTPDNATRIATKRSEKFYDRRAA